MDGKFNRDRRALLRGASLGAAAGAIAGAGALAPATAVRAQPAAVPAAAGGGTKLYILGTAAGPSVGGARYQTCYAVVVGKDVYVLDCGYGATEQLVRAGLKLPDVRNIYITHIHPDHTADLSALLYFTWYAGKESPMGIYGPSPLKQIVGDTLKALKPSMDVWLADIGHKPLEPVEVHEFTAGGPVMQDENVKVTCGLVNHPPVVPALGYRFETADRVIAFSGDTTPMESVVQLAKGADILVHEAIYADAMRRRAGPAGDNRPGGETAGSGIAGDPDRLVAHVLGSHTTPDQAGKIAQEAGVKTLVFAHIAPTPPAVTEMMYIEKARTTFSGEIIVAHDLMVL
jgi:ribonuclease BN (tRNA processing enzyme)